MSRANLRRATYSAFFLLEQQANMIYQIHQSRSNHAKPGPRQSGVPIVHVQEVQTRKSKELQDIMSETSASLQPNFSRNVPSVKTMHGPTASYLKSSMMQEIVERPQDRRPSEPAQLASDSSAVGRGIATFQQVTDAPADSIVHRPTQAPVQANGKASPSVRQRIRRRCWGPMSEGASPFKEADSALAEATNKLRAPEVDSAPADKVTHTPSVPEAQHRRFQWGNQHNPLSSKLDDEVCADKGMHSASVAKDSAVVKTAAPLSAPEQPPRRDQWCNHANLLTVPEAGSSLEPGWGLQKLSEKYFPQGIWDKPCKPPYVHVVNTVDGARRAMGLLKQLVENDKAAAQAHSRVDDIGREFWSRRVFACDTEATGIDVTSQTACGHGRVTCWTIYGGPDVNFKRDDLQVVDGDVPECVMYIDTYLGGDGDVGAVLGIWSELREFLERSDIPKVWHNYSFDKHILQRHGLGISPELLAEHGCMPEQVTLKLAGFAADTMHMARLHDAVRKAPKSYSLASLTGDKTVMSFLEPNVVARSKVSMKDIFSVPKMTKTGKLSASLKELPAIHEIQTSEDLVRRWKWVDYSAFDSKSTWDLYHSLREKLQSTECNVDDVLRKGMCGERNSYTQWDLYLDVLKPFGRALTDMEQEGFFVDKDHLAEQDKKAQEDLQDADRRFRTWLRKYAKVVGQGNGDHGWSPEEVPDLVNLSSGAQIQTLLFGGFQSSKDVLKTPTKAEAEAGMKPHNIKPQLATGRLFTVENPRYGEEGQKKQLSFQLTCVFGSEGTKIKTEWITMLTTAQGLPKTSATALRAMCGKPGVAKKLLKELDGTNVHAAGAAAAEALGDGVIEQPLSDADSSDSEHVAMTHDERSEYQASKGLGHLYMAFEDHKDGLEACAAVEALIEISAIETLRSAFLLPLQGDAVSAEDGRVHGSLNLNTETGRLSCRRPNLQNQPALEKDRYFIRKAFRAPEGRALAVADYGQLELRILAHMTSCKSMIDAFNSGGDFHSRTAVGMFSNIQEEVDSGGIAMDKMDPNYTDTMELVKDKYGSERRKAKILNFSLAYGKTEYGLSKDFGVSLEEAKQIVDRWYNSRPEVAKWQNAVRMSAKKDTGLHRVQTMLGRHRSLPGYGKGKNRLEEGRASRAAINTPIQGSAADVVAAAMVRIHDDPFLEQLGWTMLLQVHDEVIMEGPEESAEKARERLVECMRNPFVKDRARLHTLLKGQWEGRQYSVDDWNACYHCGMLLELSVDSSTASTWFDAK